MSDVAKRAGVSVSTVSRVLNPVASASISEETKERVLKAAAELNYRTNLLAQGLRLKKFNTIGFLLCERTLDQLYYYNILKAVEREATKQGLNLIFATFDNDPLPPMLNESNIDGLIVTGRVTKEKRELIERLGVPFIIVGIPIGEQPWSNIVYSDPEAEVFMALEYLLSCNHREIAYISPYKDHQLQKLTQKGFESAYQQAQLPIPLKMHIAGVEDPSPFFEKLLLDEGVTALVLQQQFTPSFYGFINRHKMSIPEDLSVIIIGEDFLDDQARKYYHYISSRTSYVGKIAVKQLQQLCSQDINYICIKASPLLHEGKSVLMFKNSFSKGI